MIVKHAAWALAVALLPLIAAAAKSAAQSAPHRPAPTEGVICATFNAPAGIDRYCVSSILKQDNVNVYQYGPECLFDNDPSTAWVEGVDGQGIGEWIVVEFDALRLVNDIEIMNGYNKGRDLYDKNSRVQEMKVEFSGRQKRSVVLKDMALAWQPIALPKDQPVQAYWVKFTIESVYPGSKLEWKDTAISELHIISEAIRP